MELMAWAVAVVAQVRLAKIPTHQRVVVAVRAL
jgi:hypothetical protein